MTMKMKIGIPYTKGKLLAKLKAEQELLEPKPVKKRTYTTKKKANYYGEA